MSLVYLILKELDIYLLLISKLLLRTIKPKSMRESTNNLSQIERGAKAIISKNVLQISHSSFQKLAYGYHVSRKSH